MDALTALHTRTSSPLLAAPPPGDRALENIYRAAFRAADHGVLRPWRFLEICGKSRQRLGDLFVAAALTDQPRLSAAQQEKLRSKPLRAPMLIIIVSCPREHRKVSEFEQHLSAAAATQNMLLACHAQGIGAMWRTGSPASHPVVRQGLGLQSQERIIGFLYLGTPAGSPRPIKTPEPAQFVQSW